MKLPFITSRLTLGLCLLGVATGTCAGNNGGEPPSTAETGGVELTAQIDRAVHSGSKLLAEARDKLGDADEATRAEFIQIEKTARAAEARLRRSLKMAETASSDNWARVRAALAANYEAYAQAVSRAERLVTLALPSPRRQPAGR
jgi:hypothetical protein